MHLFEKLKDDHYSCSHTYTLALSIDLIVGESMTIPSTPISGQALSLCRLEKSQNQGQISTFHQFGMWPNALSSEYAFLRPPREVGDEQSHQQLVLSIIKKIAIK